MKTVEVNEEMLLEANKSHLVLVELLVRNGQGTYVSKLIILVSCLNITRLMNCWNISGLMSSLVWNSWQLFRTLFDIIYIFLSYIGINIQCNTFLKTYLRRTSIIQTSTGLLPRSYTLFVKYTNCKTTWVFFLVLARRGKNYTLHCWSLLSIVSKLVR